MKKFALQGINIYQIFISNFVHQLTGMGQACRFYPTCSDYAKESINKHGLLTGGKMSAVRLLKCQPFYNGN